MADLSTSLSKQLTLDEGNVPWAYQDHLGYWTIGIGFLIDKRKGGQLYPEEIEFIFQNRQRRMNAALMARAPWVRNLDTARLGALLNMCFQMGVDGVLGFVNSMRCIERGDWEQAATNLKQSRWHDQTPNRADRIIEQIRTGIWQFEGEGKWAK